jgi:hypothetical protein
MSNDQGIVAGTGDSMRSLEFSEEDYARLKAAADADGVSPAQWIANLLINEGWLPPGYRVESDVEDQPEPPAPEAESPA